MLFFPWKVCPNHGQEAHAKQQLQTEMVCTIWDASQVNQEGYIGVILQLALHMRFLS